MTQPPRAVIVFDGEGAREPIVFVDLPSAAGWMEAIDVEEGSYEETAWFDDGEIIQIDVELVARADLRVKLTPTGRRDLPALRQALARTHPALVDADVAAIQAFTAADLTAQDDWKASRWHRRLSRWLLRRSPN
ncbi:hypothetical protein AB2L28_14380 [Kineococcus sp. TBRC 1896]|uniref:Uncharacterized protein n=1 Tax=Kineococcus mangrovi TaxID=1660183 RepID=A0ABV4I6U6_9ACTN